ncbi:hypothetical protein CHARACLAT_006869 [Characodon lateralis]|uniref:C-type lectin domain-containing protein n=1 Tax=Characodon lateralis TaxID=208331 RepID=A0ABU7ERH7_9TELE|nr:hypothetical protein [Characodon lateralis]
MSDLSAASEVVVQCNGNNELQVIGVDHETDNPLRFHNENKSWIKALQHCHNFNSTLAQINNLTVVEEVTSFLEEKTEYQNGVWIGLERSIFGTDIEWKWISGISDVYLRWNSNFPVDPLNNHCGKIIWLKESQNIQLLDGNCHEKLPFICQGKQCMYLSSVSHEAISNCFVMKGLPNLMSTVIL